MKLDPFELNEIKLALTSRIQELSVHIENIDIDSISYADDPELERREQLEDDRAVSMSALDIVNAEISKR